MIFTHVAAESCLAIEWCGCVFLLLRVGHGSVVYILHGCLCKYARALACVCVCVCVWVFEPLCVRSDKWRLVEVCYLAD